MNTPAVFHAPSAAVLSTPHARLAALLERFANDDGVTSTAIPGLSLFRATAPTEPLHCLYEPALAIVVQGRKQAMLGDAGSAGSKLRTMPTSASGQFWRITGTAQPWESKT